MKINEYVRGGVCFWRELQISKCSSENSNDVLVCCNASSEVDVFTIGEQLSLDFWSFRVRAGRPPICFRPLRGAWRVGQEGNTRDQVSPTDRYSPTCKPNRRRKFCYRRTAVTSFGGHAQGTVTEPENLLRHEQRAQSLQRSANV